MGHRDTPQILGPRTLHDLPSEVLRSCGIHGPHHQLSPPAKDKSLLRSRKPPTPLPTSGLGSGFRWAGCALEAARMVGGEM